LLKDLTPMVQRESDRYRVYYEAYGIEPYQLKRIDEFDTDKNGMTLGLKSVWQTSFYGGGLFRLRLRYYPAGGKQEADPIESDKSYSVVDVPFNLRIR